MNKIHIRFEALVQQASQEQVPPIDVVDQVVRSIVQHSPLPAFDWPMWKAAGLSVAAGLAVLILATYRGALFQDPLTHWLSSLVLVMR
jgi:hypothetical protein